MLLVGETMDARARNFSLRDFLYYHSDAVFPAQAASRLRKHDRACGTCDWDTGQMRRGRVGARVEAGQGVALDEPPAMARGPDFSPHRAWGGQHINVRVICDRGVVDRRVVDEDS